MNITMWLVAGAVMFCVFLIGFFASAKPSKKDLPEGSQDVRPEDIVVKVDLPQSVLSGAKTVTLEFRPRPDPVDVRLPDDVYEAIKIKAEANGVPCDAWIKRVLERAAS